MSNDLTVLLDLLKVGAKIIVDGHTIIVKENKRIITREGLFRKKVEKTVLELSLVKDEVINE